MLRSALTIKELKKAWIKEVIGGRAANSKRLIEELNPDCDPLGPDNLLLFGIDGVLFRALWGIIE